MKTIDFHHDDLKSIYSKIAIPAFFGVVINLFYGFVDGIFIGRYIGTEALSGVSIIFPITMIALAIVSMIGEGVGSTVSRAIAVNDNNRIMGLLKTGHGMTFWLMLFLATMSLLVSDRIVLVFGATGDINVYASTYLKYVAIGWPFMGMSLVYFHQLNAQGETRLASKAMFISTIINIILDFLFIVIFHWGVMGAAVATVIAQVLWFGLMHMWAVKKDYVKTVALPMLGKINFKMFIEVASLGMGSFIRQIGVATVLIVINIFASKYNGLNHIAAFGASQRILRLFLSPIIAISTAFKPIAGQNYSRGMYERVIEALKLGSKWTIIMGSVLFVFLIVFRNPLASLFGVSEEGIMDFQLVFINTIFLLPFFGIQHLAVAYFVSIGKVKEPMLINFLKSFVVLIPLIVVLSNLFGIIGVFVSVPIADLISTLISVYLLKKDIGKIDTFNIA